MLISRLGRVSPGTVDRILAVLGTAGALSDAFSQPHIDMNALAIASLVLLMGSIGWRRVNSAFTTVVAISALITFTYASGYNGDGSFEAAAIALNFYLLGQDARAHRGIYWRAAVLGYWVVGAVVVTYGSAPGTPGTVAGVWCLFGVLPFVFGFVLAVRTQSNLELEEQTSRLDSEQEVRARRAAAEERSRIARELHDVIGHCVSVMVVQAAGARRVASGDVAAARQALEVVEGSGREALADLRWVVGVRRRDTGRLDDGATPGLAELGGLAERARAAGLVVSLTVEGQPGELSPGLESVVYRIIQEALTNTIKHAGPAHADVSVRIGPGDVELAVSDDGCGPAQDSSACRPAYGLVGMQERAALYGGTLSAAARAGGGFEVRARIPVDAAKSAQGPVQPRGTVAFAAVDSVPSTASRAGSLGLPWLDPLLAAVVLAVLEFAVLTSTHRHGPLVLSEIAAAAIAFATLWRRVAPLLTLVAVGAVAVAMNYYLIPIQGAPMIGAYLLLVPAYWVAAWADRRRAVTGLALVLAGAAASELGTRNTTVADVAGGAFVIGAAWASGRVIRARRLARARLLRTRELVLAERDDRARLAVAGERSRIAQDLHAVAAHSVAAMVVQAAAARAQLGHDAHDADAAMAAIEDTGREALAAMRRALGVLRRTDDRAAREPAPGIHRIDELIQRAREEGQPVDLTVDGDPGTLPATVDLSIYRIIEDALQSSRPSGSGPLGVSLSFGEEELRLDLTAFRAGPSAWPTDAMRQRVAICGGQLHAAASAGSWQLNARLPRVARRSFA
jgi:signal transduction histidine kinase